MHAVMHPFLYISVYLSPVKNCNADNVRKALRTILAYADADDEVMNSTFQDQVHELIGNMHMILRDTINLTECNKVSEIDFDALLHPVLATLLVHHFLR